jgi:hypothetical protein
MKIKNYRKYYEGFLTQFEWEYMVTIRKNYRTNENVVRNTSNKLINKIDEVKTAVFVGEVDSTDDRNLHIHILLSTNDKPAVLKKLIKHRSNNRGDNIVITDIEKNPEIGSSYVTKQFDMSMRKEKNIIWDIIIKPT